MMSLASSVRRYVDLNDEEITALRRKLRPLAVQRKEAVLSPGTPATFLAFVERGCLRVYESDRTGKQYTFQFAAEGDWTGDLGGFVSQGASRYYVEALEPAALLLLDYSALEAGYLETPRLERLFRILYQNAYVACQGRVVAAMSQSAADLRHA